MLPRTRQILALAFLAALTAGESVVGQGTPTPVASNSVSPANRAAALELYLKGNYTQAAVAFDALPPSSDGATRARTLYCKALCQVGQRYAAPAIQSLLAAAQADPGGAVATPALLKAAELAAQQSRGALRALEILGQLQTGYPNSPAAADAEFAIGRLREQAAEFDKALAAYAEVAQWEKSHPRRGDTISLVSRLAAARESFIRDNGDTEYRPLRMYLEAQRMALRPARRNEALMQLIRLAGLYPDAALVDDAFVEMTRIHLLKGDEPAARQTFDRLLKSAPQRLEMWPLRAIALRGAGWLLDDADKDVASEADVFPELAGYRAGMHLTFLRDASPAWRLELGGNGHQTGLRQLAFRMTVRRTLSSESPALTALGLRVDTSVESGSDVLAAEVRRTLDIAVQALHTLDRAVVGTPQTGQAVAADAGKSGSTGPAPRG